MRINSKQIQEFSQVKSVKIYDRLDGEIERKDNIKSELKLSGLGNRQWYNLKW